MLSVRADAITINWWCAEKKLCGGLHAQCFFRCEIFGDHRGPTKIPDMAIANARLKKQGTDQIRVLRSREIIWLYSIWDQ